MIPLFKVHTLSNVGELVQKVFDQGTVTEGVYSDEFEAKLAYRFGAHTSLVNSGTSALTLAYRMCDVGPGKEVISTPMTCMATNAPIDTMGGDIVWADIEPDTGNISPADVERKITDKTCAIVGVHWSGLPFKILEIRQILKKLGREDIKIIADAAHAFGGSYHGIPIGSEADYTCFSFQAIKHLTTVDGGAITCKSADEDLKIKKLRWFGLSRKYVGEKWSQDITDSGYKFHMNNVNAIIGLEQLKHVDKIVSSHMLNGLFYDRWITNPKVKKLTQDQRNKNACWIYTVVVDDREAFRNHLNSNGIACDVVHFRNDKYSSFARFARNDLPGVDYFCSHMINIPVGWWLSQKDLDHVVEVVNRY